MEYPRANQAIIIEAETGIRHEVTAGENGNHDTSAKRVENAVSKKKNGNELLQLGHLSVCTMSKAIFQTRFRSAHPATALSAEKTSAKSRRAHKGLRNSL